MIFLTVGTYPPGFDRLVTVVDHLCNKYKVRGVAQISGGIYTPNHMKSAGFYPQEIQQQYLEECDFVITHGGFGVVGDLLRLGKPFIVFPRPLNEGPNDQRPVAYKLAKIFNLTVCHNLDDLERYFKEFLEKKSGKISNNLNNNIPELISDFINKT